MSYPPRQLPLPLVQSQSYDAGDFHPTAGSRLATEWLDRPDTWSNGRLILWGEAGVGKTHLLHSWATARGAQRIDYVIHPDKTTTILVPLAIDNADLVTDEIWLFHLLNRASDARQPMLLTSREPPSRHSFCLADLASRLRASTIVEVSPPTDEERAAILARLAASRQLVLNIQVQNFLLTRLPRTAAALTEAIARLDHASLAAGGKISRSLAAGLLKDIANPEPPGSEMLLNGHSQDTPDLL